ncbi:KRAB-A domain-containing protein 2-like, partial [Centruroides sculpturatus]|uniref:KRAB-A domain-containing protein 2-like n=1 Tax=Centruroides sculpturatus TaxID=218467 RepID=UPI000C6DE4C0
MNSRCQVDLIDFQTQPDGKFKFIMVYQDHLAKFILLRALESKRAEEVAYHLNDIFLTIGAPCILQSDNEREFVNRIICEMTSLWPELKLVHGKPRHSQSQGSVERANQDVENMISCWLKDNHSTKWSEGLRYVQFVKNRAYHSGIKQLPYKAMFGVKPRVGLSTTSLPPEIIKDIQDEDDVQKLIETDLNHRHTNDHNNSGDDSDCNDIETSKIGDDIQKARQTAAENLQKQAKKMKSASDKSHPPAKVGDNVTVPIPDVDRGRGDLRNVIGVVLEINNDGLYKIGTKHGILQTLYCRTEFDICTQKFLQESDVNQDVQISLRTAATKHSVGTGQGFIRCTCTKNCATNRCQCKKK